MIRLFVIGGSALALLACGTTNPTTPMSSQSPVAGMHKVVGETATPTPAPPTPSLAPAKPQPPVEPSVNLRPPTPTPQSEPSVIRWRVVGPGVNAPIAGSYTDCSGKAPVGWAGAYYDTCQPGPWIMAHPPFFGAMNSWGIGTAVTVYDGSGNGTTYHIINSRVFNPGAGGFSVSGSAHFQVCTANIPNSTVRVLDAA
jgi:hypothetical protein